ncbi:MAG: type II toxin-antitoxin system VapC family toxin [bacterium]
MRIAFDTHVLLYWVSAPGRLTAAQQHAVRTISSENPAIVADISGWEIAMLVAAGKVQLSVPLRDWLTRALAPPLVRLAEITPNIAAATTDLHEWQNRDPADRLIVSTAHVYGAALLTNDAQIRESGFVDVV